MTPAIPFPEANVSLYMENPNGSPDSPATPYIPTVPLPEVQDVVFYADNPPVVLHPFLSIEPGHIRHNFAAPLSEGMVPGSDEVATHVYATRPPISSLKITCHPLGKELRILPGEPITVSQMLTWTHQWLHEPVTDDAYHNLDPDLQQRVNATYIERCLAIGEPGIRAMAFREGRKAIDLLCGLRKFRGFFNTGDGMTFELLLDTHDEVVRLE
jgi:hypothetical protein